MLEFLSQQKPKILIIGDFMVDNYTWCDCSRISPEAPVLVAKTLKEDKRLGGAANVYANLKSLGADVLRSVLWVMIRVGNFYKKI